MSGNQRDLSIFTAFQSDRLEDYLHDETSNIGQIVEDLKLTHAATVDANRSRELTAEERAAWDEVAATGMIEEED